MCSESGANKGVLAMIMMMTMAIEIRNYEKWLHGLYFIHG